MSFNTPRGQRKEPLMSKLVNRFQFSDWLADKLNLQEEFPISTIRKIAFIFFLAIIYIFFQHNIETLVRDLSKSERELKEKRAAYITHKSSYMFESKQSQVSAALAERGLHNNIEPPIKIALKP